MLKDKRTEKKLKENEGEIFKQSEYVQKIVNNKVMFNIAFNFIQFIIVTILFIAFNRFLLKILCLETLILILIFMNNNLNMAQKVER